MQYEYHHRRPRLGWADHADQAVVSSRPPAYIVYSIDSILTEARPLRLKQNVGT
jgi:hypothetical protein